MVDADWYRPNVGIVLSNSLGKVFWARRIGERDSWQFPQGGIDEGESEEEALYRELFEEIGLLPKDVAVVASTKEWLYYDLPIHLRRGGLARFKGQKQKWFLLKLQSDEIAIALDKSPVPEFDAWRWVSCWYPLEKIVTFKREVYKQALIELVPCIGKSNASNQHGRF